MTLVMGSTSGFNLGSGKSPLAIPPACLKPFKPSYCQVEKTKPQIALSSWAPLITALNIKIGYNIKNGLPSSLFHMFVMLSAKPMDCELDFENSNQSQRVLLAL